MRGRTWKLKSSLLCTNRSNFLSYSPPIIQLSFHFPNFPLVFRVLHSIRDRRWDGEKGISLFPIWVKLHSRWEKAAIGRRGEKRANFKFLPTSPFLHLRLLNACVACSWMEFCKAALSVFVITFPSWRPEEQKLAHPFSSSSSRFWAAYRPSATKTRLDKPIL